MLNEECQLNRDVDNVRLVQRIDDLKNPVLKRVAMNSPSVQRRQPVPQLRSGTEESFSVKHYAGSVSYSMTNMIEKNKDKVAQDLVDLVDESENGFLKELFADWDNPNLLRGAYFIHLCLLLGYIYLFHISTYSLFISSLNVPSSSSFLPLPHLPIFPSLLMNSSSSFA